MTLRGLAIVVCLLMVLGICTTVPAWAADHGAGVCAAGGGGSGSGGGGGCGGGSSVGSGAVGAGAGAEGIAASSVTSPNHTGAIAQGIGAAIGVGNGATSGGVSGGIGVNAGDDQSGATAPQRAVQPYSLRAIYFRRDRFKSTADCLAAAHGQGLPLEVCQ